MIVYAEQSGEIEDRSDIKDAVDSVGGEFLRYNWKYGASGDPFANVDYPKGLSWSKGREALFNNAFLNFPFQWIIFADDDLVFSPNVSSGLEQFVYFLKKSDLKVGTIHSENWHNRYVKTLHKRFKKKSYRYFLADLQVQVFSFDAASNAFPVRYDGGHGTLWPPVIECKKNHGKYPLCFSECSVFNSRRNFSGDYSGIFNRRSADVWKDCSRDIPLSVRILKKRFGIHKSVALFNALLYLKS